MSISRDGKHVNLWDLLTDVPTEPCREVLEMRRAEGQMVKKLLNKVSRIQGQEFSLDVDEKGWTIKVFSCFAANLEPKDRNIFEVFIPADRNMAIRVTTGAGEKDMEILKEIS